MKEKQSPPQNQAAPNTNKAKRNTNQQFPNNPAHTTYAKAASTGGIENGINFMRITSPTHKQQQQQQQQPQTASVDLGTSPLANFIASNNLAQLKGAMPSDVKDIESQRQQNDPNLQALLKKPAAMGAAKSNNIGNNASNNTTPGKPAKLMPPTMFETTATEPSSGNTGVGNAANTGSGQRAGPMNTNQKAGKNESNETNKKNSMQKGKETGNPKSRKKSSHEQQSQMVQQNDDLSTAAQPLTETQLLQAISYLMKNDPSFIRKIHEAYLKSFAEMVSQ